MVLSSRLAGAKPNPSVRQHPAFAARLCVQRSEATKARYGLCTMFTMGVFRDAGEDLHSRGGRITGMGVGSTKRDTYRHGDLRRALVEAGMELARGGGPEAMLLREATRRVGVAPSAAYRRFADR